MELATNNRHVSGNCWKGFQGQRSKVKVIAMTNALFPLRDDRRRIAVRPLPAQRHTRNYTDRSCGVEAVEVASCVKVI